MATARQFTYKNPASQLGYSQNMANLADTNIYIAPKGTNADPLDIDDWALLGIVTADANINPNLENFEVMTGSIQTRKVTIKVKQADSLEVEMSHLTLVGLQLAYANDFLPSLVGNITYATNGQTTVSSSIDKSTTVLASATNIAVGDLCLVQHSVNGAKYYDELAYIETVSGNTVTHNILSYSPAANTPFKKIKGSALVDTGIKLISGGAKFPEVEVLIVRYLHPSKGLFIQHRPKGQIVSTNGFTFSVSEPMKTTATFNFIDIGSSNDGCLYGYDYLVPKQS
jgi:hypothetical protein